MAQQSVSACAQVEIELVRELEAEAWQEPEPE
jgi:hypothetical protein